MERRTFLSLFFFLLFYGCIEDAPHTNPVDPVFGLKISGRVERFYSTTPISGATVQLIPGSNIVLTNSEGSFTFSADPGIYDLICTAPGFVRDTLTVEISQDQTEDVRFQLNALPGFESVSLTTEHINPIFPPDIFRIRFQVNGQDPDQTGDITQVSYELSELGFTDTLSRLSPGAATFVGFLSPQQAGVTELPLLLGKAFRFQIEDLPGAKSISKDFFISRIIDFTPVTSEPNGDTNLPINFQWLAADVNFPFTYKIEIYPAVAIVLPPVVELSNIPSTETSLLYQGPLETGNYYWVLHVVDEFGNQSRSGQKALNIN